MGDIVCHEATRGSNQSYGARPEECAGVRLEECGDIHRIGKSGLSVCGCSHSTNLPFEVQAEEEKTRAIWSSSSLGSGPTRAPPLAATIFGALHAWAFAARVFGQATSFAAGERHVERLIELLWSESQEERSEQLIRRTASTRGVERHPPCAAHRGRIAGSNRAPRKCRGSLS
jgi:hypothetical protein